ncbi:hypothetical protein LTR48_002189 [Friedmanniomyces endolithicus]|nr:hypothetical protein LTR48_002189 [Friedmanniomyces endolithicus]
MDSPSMNTTFWSTSFFGAVRKKYAAVMWKSEMVRIIVKPDMRPMAYGLLRVTTRCQEGCGSPEKGWNGSLAPPIFSHSSAKALCPHPRNVPDDILQLVKKRNGVVMVNFSPDFVSCRAGNASTGLPDFVEETNTIEHVVEHIMHIGELIGYDYVGLGSDFDGIPTTPRGLDDVSKFPDLMQLLLDNGVSKKNAGKIAGLNLLRVWHEVDKVAARLQKEMKPVEDYFKPGIRGLYELEGQESGNVAD